MFLKEILCHKFNKNKKRGAVTIAIIPILIAMLFAAIFFGLEIPLRMVETQRFSQTSKNLSYALASQVDTTQLRTGVVYKPDALDSVEKNIVNRAFKTTYNEITKEYELTDKSPLGHKPVIQVIATDGNANTPVTVEINTINDGLKKLIVKGGSVVVYMHVQYKNLLFEDIRDGRQLDKIAVVQTVPNGGQIKLQGVPIQ